MSYRFGWYNFPSSSRMPSNFCEALKHLMIQNKIESHDFEVKVCYRSNILYAVGIVIIWFMELKAPIWNGFQSTGPFTFVFLFFCCFPSWNYFMIWVHSPFIFCRIFIHWIFIKKKKKTVIALLAKETCLHTAVTWVEWLYVMRIQCRTHSSIWKVFIISSFKDGFTQPLPQRGH